MPAPGFIRLTSEDKIEICVRYRGGESGKELARAFGRTTGTIYNVLREAQVPVHNPGARRGDRALANHPMWKGGRSADRKGYVLISVGGGRKVKEHRLVMQEHLGRELEKHENVHHINGVKHDNRLENLELWSSSQPSGQRVEDKATWAREILALYGEEDERGRYSCKDR